VKLTDKGGVPITIGFILSLLDRLKNIFSWPSRIGSDHRPLAWRTSMQCKICGQDNPPEARFCANCGATLVASTDMPAATVVPSQAAAAPVIAVEYAGFWIRFRAAIIDAVVVSVLSFILSFLPYLRPGLVGAALRKILGKLISSITLFVGFLWIAFDSNKQGWHDKIASTYVVKVKSRK
jgi:hypothetical protein